MDRALGALYRRLGRAYPLVFATFALVSAFALLTIVVFVGADSYLGLPRAATRRILLFGVAGLTLAIGAAFLLTLRVSLPAWRWIAGDRRPETARDAWASAVRIPRRLISFGLPCVVLGVTPAVAMLTAASELRVYSALGIYVGNLLTIALGLILNQVAIETMLRPVLAEIDAAYPASGVEARAERMSQRRRIVVSGLLVVVVSAWLTTGLTSSTADPAERLALTVVAALAVGVTFSLVLTVVLSQSLFGPIRELIQATRRVASGDLSTRMPVVSNDELGALARSFNAMVGGLAEREALRSALGTYVDPGLAERILSEGQILAGEEVDVTVMFVDIVAFSARAELMPADLVCAELNEFFGLVVPAVEEHGGHTNKLIGDGLLAVFGTPIKLDDHADSAVRAACTIQQRLQDRYRGTLRAGIGVHSGSVVVGTMGGGSKLDFTLIGDAVNVASRVEALTRQTGDAILITEATKDALRTRDTVLSSRGTETIRGRSEPVSLYAVASRIPA
jgi:class 3 adenylate cyclase